MVYLAISVDVEEEGLFSGAYPRSPTVENLRHLDKLDFLYREFGLPLTLLTAYPVVMDPSSRDVLLRWREERGAEIGAHLHHWNTPPLVELGLPDPVPSDSVPLEVLREKFATLVRAIEGKLGVRPESFRMGRWDFGRQVEALLPEFGFRVDSSVAPLRHGPQGADRFLCPADPYWLPQAEPRVLEVPITVLPLWGALPRMAHSVATHLSERWRGRFLARFKSVAAMGIQPVWFPLFSMNMAARLHIRRGGRVLCMFFHSSELMPGQSPHFPDEAAVQSMLFKIGRFVERLRSVTEVRGVTLSQLPELLAS